VSACPALARQFPCRARSSSRAVRSSAVTLPVSSGRTRRVRAEQALPRWLGQRACSVSWFSTVATRMPPTAVAGPR